MPGYLRLILIMEMFAFLIVYMGLYGAVERLSKAPRKPGDCIIILRVFQPLAGSTSSSGF